eukprot:Skav213660  [mRNA]  locus=scaffold2012:464398:467700:- [translate_table: standard]
MFAVLCCTTILHFQWYMTTATAVTAGSRLREGFIRFWSAVSTEFKERQVIPLDVDCASYLTPLYQEAARAIRGNGAKQVFPAPALGADRQQALSYHIYCAPGEATVAAGDGDSWPAGLLCDAAQQIFDAWL